MATIHPLLSKIELHPRIDGIRILGLICVLYIAFFVLYFGFQIPLEEILVSSPYELIALISGTFLILAGLLLSLRTTCVFGWSIIALVQGFIFDLPSFVIQNTEEIIFISVGLGIPLLILLEIVLTMEGANAKARVVFRGKALLKASLIVSALLSSLIFVFSHWNILEQYSTSPETATFHSAIIAGLATIILARLLISELDYKEVLD